MHQAVLEQDNLPRADAHDVITPRLKKQGVMVVIHHVVSVGTDGHGGWYNSDNGGYYNSINKNNDMENNGSNKNNSESYTTQS